jgi:ribosomal protein L23
MFMKVLYALTSEKAVAAIEKFNTLTFVVTDDASKSDIKKEVEASWGEKIVGINTVRTLHGSKKAHVRFAKKGAASEIAGKLKLI